MSHFFLLLDAVYIYKAFILIMTMDNQTMRQETRNILIEITSNSSQSNLCNLLKEIDSEESQLQ